MFFVFSVGFVVQSSGRRAAGIGLLDIPPPDVISYYLGYG